MRDCPGLEEADLSGLDTSNIKTADECAKEMGFASIEHLMLARREKEEKSKTFIERFISKVW